MSSLNFPPFDVHGELRIACTGMLRRIQAQLELGPLADEERVSAPVAQLERALEADDQAALLEAGQLAHDWIWRNAPADEAEMWRIECPHPALDGFEMVQQYLEPEEP